MNQQNQQKVSGTFCSTKIQVMNTLRHELDTSAIQTHLTTSWQFPKVVRRKKLPDSPYKTNSSILVSLLIDYLTFI
jgi:hypothetical protein